MWLAVSRARPLRRLNRNMLWSTCRVHIKFLPACSARLYPRSSCTSAATLFSPGAVPPVVCAAAAPLF